MANNQVIQRLFGDGRVESIPQVFDELLLIVESLKDQADSLTDENAGIEACRRGTTLAISINRIQQLASLGFDLAVQTKQPARVTAKKGR